MNKKILVLITLVLTLSIAAVLKSAKESFIVQPKPKKESRNTINESIGHLMLSINKKFAQLIKHSAHHLETSNDEGESLMYQEKSSLYDSGELQDLQCYRAKLQEVSDNLDSALRYFSTLKLNSKEFSKKSH